jgi:hypothetical protein
MTSATLQQRPQLPSQTPSECDDASAHVEQNATQTLSSHPHFHGRTDSICVECHRETLIVTGRMPSFYLKQLLQEVLRQVDGVNKIDNRVDVICSDGLSSTLRK